MEKDIKDIEVSYYHNTRSTNTWSVSLGSWMSITINPKPWMKELSLQYRETGDKKHKAELPAITPGGIFDPGSRVADDVIHKTGIICFDIDGKENKHIQDWEEVKEVLPYNKYVIFTALSTSGNGCYGFIMVEDPDKQKDYFKQLSADFKDTYGLVVDSTKGKNCNDLRYYSYDPEPYYNPEWVKYDRLPKIKLRKPTYVPKHLSKLDNPEDTVKKVRAVIKELQDRHIDLNPSCDYEMYRSLAWAFCDPNLSPYNRELYHNAMSTHSRYDYKMSDREFNKLQKSYRQGKTTIATFFNQAKKMGVNLSETFKKL